MNYINGAEVKNIIINALKEDLGKGDITSRALITEKKYVKAAIFAKEPCVACGLSIAGMVFKLQDEDIKFKSLVKDGESVKKGTRLAQIYGRAKSILGAERVALNFLSHLCGISTKTRAFVKAVSPCKTKILDTRKTIPGMRLLEKYAVRIGGGFNHRLSLDEMVMIKDNHRKILGDRLWALDFKKMKTIIGGLQIEIEVNNLSEFKKALQLKPDIIMLDNMAIRDLRKAVEIRNCRTPKAKYQTPKLEASGGVSLKNVKKIASCGVDRISIGELTHSVESVDLSLEIL